MQNKNIYDICAPRRLFVFLHSNPVFMKNLILLLAITTFNFSFSQQWKEMANDININLYDVVAEAEAYFEYMKKANDISIDKLRDLENVYVSN